MLKWIGSLALILSLMLGIGFIVVFANERGLDAGSLGALTVLSFGAFLSLASLLRKVITKARGPTAPSAAVESMPLPPASESETAAAPVHGIFRRVDEEISSGRVWRAKEMLDGYVRSAAFDPVIYERYGQILLLMQDKLNAGRFLFLSGVSRKEYEEPIALFMARYARQPQQLYAALPARAKLSTLEAYPESVAAELGRLGIRLKPTRRSHSLGVVPSAPFPWLESGWTAYILVVVFLCFLVGFIWLGTAVIKALA
jgi:hypothetical protein